MVDLFKEANASNKKAEIGSKAYNSLKLVKINKKEGGEFFFTPQQVSVPMSAPLKFESDPDFADVRKLYD